MRIALLFALMIPIAGSIGCRSSSPSASVTSAPSTGDVGLEQRVGQQVMLEGVVSQTKCPQVQGVDVWGLEALAGQRVRVSGILRRTIVTQADIDPMVANRGPGTFYSLDEMTYEPIK